MLGPLAFYYYYFTNLLYILETAQAQARISNLSILSQIQYTNTFTKDVDVATTWQPRKTSTLFSTEDQDWLRLQDQDQPKSIEPEEEQDHRELRLRWRTPNDYNYQVVIILTICNFIPFDRHDSRVIL